MWWLYYPSSLSVVRAREVVKRADKHLCQKSALHWIVLIIRGNRKQSKLYPKIYRGVPRERKIVTGATLNVGWSLPYGNAP